jgi:hypothetical protein
VLYIYIYIQFPIISKPEPDGQLDTHNVNGAKYTKMLCLCLISPTVMLETTNPEHAMLVKTLEKLSTEQMPCDPAAAELQRPNPHYM